jgi:hypothetical protein
MKVKVTIDKEIFEIEKDEIKKALSLMGKALCGNVTAGCVVAAAKLIGDNPKGFMWSVMFDRFDSFLENIKEVVIPP